MQGQPGTKVITSRFGQNRAIIEFVFEKYTLYVFHGRLSQYDIFIKYKSSGTRLRTPKHIHWVIDILIKMQYDKELTQDFLKEVKRIWNNSVGLEDNSYLTLKALIENNESDIHIEKFRSLDKYGEYPVEFLFVMMELLSVQEKTNRRDAYMFGNVINKLLEEHYDIFSIVSAAGYNGRK